MKTPTSFRLDDEVVVMLRKLADMDDRSQANILERLIRKEMLTRRVERCP